MSKIMSRAIKALFYPFLPSSSSALHAKRRKGLLYRNVATGVLECQKEQDRIFWEKFLMAQEPGFFLEVGGDGVVGSNSLGLETILGWKGAFWANQAKLRDRAKSVRKCRILKNPEDLTALNRLDLLAIHSPTEYFNQPNRTDGGLLQARWIIVENREPDPVWCRRLERSGYRLKFFFHDDEYYELQA
jgi:hypothetical protein